MLKKNKQTSTSHHNHTVNLKIHQLLKAQLLPHMQTEWLPLDKWLYWGVGSFVWLSSALVLPPSLKYTWWDGPKMTNHHILEGSTFWDLPQNRISSARLSQENCKSPKQSDMSDIRPRHWHWKCTHGTPDTGAKNKCYYKWLPTSCLSALRTRLRRTSALGSVKVTWSQESWSAEKIFLGSREEKEKTHLP